MQQQPYPNYGPYYYPPFPQNNAPYPSFYGGPPPPTQPPQAPHTNNPPGPSPYSFDAGAYNLKPNASVVAQSRRHRKNSSTPATAAPAAPLKSAMKKTVNVFNQAEATIGRQLSNPFYNPASGSQNNPNAPMQMPRPRVYSNPTYPENVRDDPYNTDMEEPIACN